MYDWLLLVSLMLFVVYPEADPGFLKSTLDIHDAAWWADPAKQYVLNGRWMNGPFAGALCVGPLTVFLHTVSFKMFGLHFWSLRLLSLLPGIAAIILVRRHQKKAYTALLLALSPCWYDWSRIGLPETLMGLLLLAAVIGIRDGRKFYGILAALCVIAGMLVKSSFVYYLPAILMAFGSLPKKDRIRAIGRFSGIFIVGSGLIYVFYFQRFEWVFSPFFGEFKQGYFTIHQLIDPAGFMARLLKLLDREFFSDPMVAGIILSILWRIHQGKGLHSNRGFTLIWIVAIGCLFASDFAGRRFIPLLPLVVLSLEEFSSSKSLSERIKLFLAHLLVLVGIGWTFPANWIMHFQEGYFVIHWPVYAVIVSMLVVSSIHYFSQRSMNQSVQLYLDLASVWFGIVLIGSLLENHLGCNHSLAFGGGIALMSVVLFFLKYMNHLSDIQINVKVLTLVCVSFILFRVSYLFTARSDERDAAMKFASEVKPGEFIAGPPSVFSLAFLSRGEVMHFPESALWAHKEPNWIGGISTANPKEIPIKQQVIELSGLIDTSGMAWESQKVWSGREEACWVRLR